MTKFEIARLIESLRPYLYVSEQYFTKSELIDWYNDLISPKPDVLCSFF